MSGGKSKTSSKTTTKTTQNIANTTTQAEASGVISGDVFQGENINFNQDFSSEVAGAFGQLVELTNFAISGAGSIAEQSINKVAERSAQIENPSLATTQEITPIFLMGGGLLAVVLIFNIWSKK